MKKDTIERECQGLLEFIESSYTLDNIAGLDAVRVWLREDARVAATGACSMRSRWGISSPGASAP